MNGIIIIDKPAGWTSHDVVAKLRGVLAEKRVGHAGTLDPMATGVLPIFVGRATRAVEFAAEGSKEYVVGLRLGITTDTQDTTGTTLAEKPVAVTAEQLTEALAAFHGDILQLPPMYSAIKINGQKLYELARRGKEVERELRPITIHELEVLEQQNATDFILRVACSKGSYMRTLCHDIGAALGVGGAMFSLRRTKAAGFTIENAVPLEEATAANLTPVDHFFLQHKTYAASTAQTAKARNGVPFVATDAPDGTYRVYDPAGDFLLLGRASDGLVTTIKSFFEP